MKIGPASASIYLILFGPLSAAWFGDARAQSSMLEEVIVTAQKREESVQDVGIAINAFSGEQLQQLGFNDTTEIANITPGLFVSGSSAGQNAQFSVRGVTQPDFLDAIEGPTAIYVDEGYVAQQNAGTQALFDVNRVEVLKGPQGTLFGRNATGGLVHFITNKPSEEPEGYVDLTAGDYSLINFKGAVGGPLSDSVRGRVSFYYREHDEIFDNLYPLGAVGGPFPGGGQDIWNDDTVAARAQLTFDVSDDVEVYLMAHGSKIDQSEAPYQSRPVIGVFDEQGRHINTIDIAPNETREGIGPGGVNFDADGNGIVTTRPVPGGDFFGFIDPDGEDFDISREFAFEDGNTFELYGVNAKVTWDYSDAATFTSVTDYKKYDRTLGVDVDAGPADVLQFNTITDNSSLTQELRVNGTADNFRWVGGFYYLTIDADVLNGFVAGPNSVIAGLAGTNAPNVIALDTDSYSIFGQVDYDLSDRLTLTGGLRVIREEKDWSLAPGLYLSTNFREHDTDVLLAPFPAFLEDVDPATGGCISCGPYTEDTSDTLWSGKIGLDYQVNDDLMLYATLNRGIKAGAFNAPLPLTGPPLPRDQIGYDEEVLNALELGFKSDLLDGTMRLNGSLFYYDYSDYHTFTFNGVSGIVENRDATNVGVELDLLANPAEGLELVFGVSYFDFEVEDVTITPGLTRDVEPPFAPDLQLSGLIRYTFDAWGGQLALQADANYRSEFYHNINNFDANEYGDDTVGNARVTYYSADNRWEASLFVNNLTDERRQTIGFDLQSFCGCNEDGYAPPRWWGVNFRYHLF